MTAGLDAAHTDLAVGRADAACGTLTAFTNEARAQTNKELTQGRADQLIAGATQLRDELGC